MNNRRGVDTPGPVDASLARSAESQHGLLTRQQLLDAGLDDNAIHYRLKVGRLHRIHQRVYAIGHRPPSPLARALAAVLACGPGAVLSHHSAATLWELQPRWRLPLEVTARGNRRHRGVRLHRSRTLSDTDVTVQLGVPVTTVARTLLDLAATVDDASLARLLNEARIRRQLRAGEVESLLARAAGRATARLRRLVEPVEPPTRSHFEDAFLDFARGFGLPRPEVNQRIAGHEVDMLWRERRLIVELDGYTFHSSRTAFEHDRRRDADLQAAGYRVVRITWQRLANGADAEARRLLAILGGVSENPE